MLSRLFAAVVVLLAVLVYYIFIYSSNEEIIIESKYGSIKGLKSLSRDGREFYSFRAIPYAKPPVGELRFQPPVEVEKWEGILDARKDPPVCLQAHFVWKSVFGQEDCLYINVFTPNLKNKDKLLPVMHFHHGGYFMLGDTETYGPDYFMDEDVVLVSFQYRLGALGFLSTGDDVVSGNMGLKDQVMALKWVQSTIKDFGGDPNLVTIFGVSAGAVSTHLHMFSPLSKGLFHRVISQSGTGLCPWADLNKDAKAQARKLGEELNCPLSSSEALVKCLKSMDGKRIVETHKSYFSPFSGPGAIYGPTIEHVKDPSKAFLTESPRSLYETGNFAKLPWMSGVNQAEGCWLSSPIINDEEKLDKLSTNWNTLAPELFIYHKRPDASAKILKYYFGATQKTFSMEDYGKLTDMYSDRYFLACQGETSRLHANHAPTYLYYFNHQSPKTMGVGFIFGALKGKYPVILELLTAILKYWLYTNILDLETLDYGVCHGEELRYQFSTPVIGISKSSPNYEFSKSFIKLWVSFAKNGYPGKYKGIEWKNSEKNEPPRYMYIGEPPEMIEEPFTAHMKFWESLQLTPK